jgi:hypothetical protein
MKVLLLLLLGFLAHPGISHAVINGDAAFEKKYSAIGSLKIGETDSAGCTATLITEKWIVTAAHCISDGESEGEEAGEPLTPADYEFRIGADFHKPEFQSKLKRWVLGPNVNGEDLDIAFGELASPVPLVKLNISTIAIRNLHWNAKDLNSPYIHIGYGAQEAFVEGHPLENKRQIAKFVVTSAKGNALLNLFGNAKKLETYLNTYHPQSIDSASLEANIYNAELMEKYSVHAWDTRGREDLNKIQVPIDGWQGTCFGDSGGPLLSETDGKLFMVGVVSQGMDRICSPIGTKFITFGPKVLDMARSLNSRLSPNNVFTGFFSLFQDTRKTKPHSSDRRLPLIQR